MPLIARGPFGIGCSPLPSCASGGVCALLSCILPPWLFRAPLAAAARLRSGYPWCSFCHRVVRRGRPAVKEE